MTRILIALSLLGLLSLPALGDTKRKPNIVIVLADDLGYADVGFHGCKDIPTPNLDALAKTSVRCTNGYVSGPYCSPTRAALLTGRYQQRFGHEFNPSGTNGLPTTEKTIADRLNLAGYATALVGKWHLGSPDEMRPQKRGFGEFFGFLGGQHSYFESQGILRGNEPAKEKEYLTDALGREAVAFIDKNKEKPFFLYLAFNAVHTPMHADDARLKKFDKIGDKTRRTYAAMLFAMDEAIGRVRKKLADEKLEKDTLVFFFSDNGGPTMKGTTTNGSVNTPLRGSKRTTLEGGVRVPFLVSWPGQVKPGVYHEPVIQMDLTATALTAAGATPKAEWKLDGVDLLPYFGGEKKGSPHEALYWRFGAQMAIRAGDWKLVRYDPVIDGGKGQATATKLYNLAEDIGESKDLTEKHPDRVTELQKQWDAWNATLAKPRWGGGKKAK